MGSNQHVHTVGTALPDQDGSMVATLTTEAGIQRLRMTREQMIDLGIRCLSASTADFGTESRGIPVFSFGWAPFPDGGVALTLAPPGGEGIRWVLPAPATLALRDALAKASGRAASPPDGTQLQ